MRTLCLRVSVTLWVLFFVPLGAEQAAPHLPPLDRVLPPRVEGIYSALTARVDGRIAMETVGFMSQYWRLAGNPGYDRSIDFLVDRLMKAGVPNHVDEFENSGGGWELVSYELAIEGTPNGIVLAIDRDRLAVCINSFSTPPSGLSLPIVDAGGGTDAADYEGKEVKGALVLGTGAVGQLWTRAVRERGAAGVVSTALAPYTRPDSTPDVLQWGSIPYDEARHSFGFKATPQAAERLRARLAAGSFRARVTISTRFHKKPNRTLVAKIPGTDRATERVVLVAHVQEPGASDNASGSGTLLSAAIAMQDAIARGAIARPRRTIMFMWLDEIRGSERWIKDHPAEAAKVIAMMSLDMTGEDTTKTGGTFLIEKSPDPSALWPRPSDPHTEWGAGKVEPALVRGHFLNDLHLAICLRRARDTGWIVRTNPYEGGSDHTVFTRAGVAALLNWHFTDRYYHTNLDTPDKTSADTMVNVATAVSTTAMFLALAGDEDEPALVALVDEAERARLATERANAATDEILAAWKKWYSEARESARNLKRQPEAELR
jgi:aminopeptidase YwaD